MSKKKTPAGPTAEALSEKVSQHFDSAIPSEIQVLRAFYLARRFALAPQMARAVASLVWEGRR